MPRKVVSQSSSTSIVKKKTIQEQKVTLSRVATDLQYMGDVNFGELDETKDGLIVSYDSNTNKFVLITADEVLTDAASDNDLPDSFIDAVEEEINLGDISLQSLDGGAF